LAAARDCHAGPHDLQGLLSFFGGSFHTQFLISTAAALLYTIPIPTSRTMSSNTGTSILDEALTYIGQRIASILIQPGEKDKHYIASLHNEVVSIP